MKGYEICGWTRPTGMNIGRKKLYKLNQSRLQMKLKVNEKVIQQVCDATHNQTTNKNKVVFVP